MPYISRRGLLTASALAVPAALLGCAAFKNLTPQQIATAALGYGATLANALANVATGLKGVPAAKQQQITKAAQDAATAAGQLQSGMTQNAAQPVANRIIEDITLVATIAAPYMPPGSPEAIIMSNAQTAEPLFLAAVGIFTAGAAPGANSQTAMDALKALPVVHLK